ncbi:MAG: S-layer homology domain-containing protein [Oscillospiraceae bacterium]|nr:S-layer homology domain-containing protein [Oscillospiraceae bacterium]
MMLWICDTTGTADTTFSPYEKCERCQVVTFLYRAFGEPEITDTTNPFTDVDTDDYFYNAVLWAVEEGVTSGTTATTFGPFVTCERCMIVTFLYRALAE